MAALAQTAMRRAGSYRQGAPVGLTDSESNHGEDVKEEPCFHLDGTSALRRVSVEGAPKRGNGIAIPSRFKKGVAQPLT
jgi:hypothetical protein